MICRFKKIYSLRDALPRQCEISEVLINTGLILGRKREVERGRDRQRERECVFLYVGGVRWTKMTWTTLYVKLGVITRFAVLNSQAHSSK